VSEETPVPAAVIHVLDGGLVPHEERREPLRRVELAVIWLAEAQRELDEAIIEAYQAGARSSEIGRAADVTGSAVRNWVQKLRETGRLV
jgi:hypothetical protein